MSNFDVNSGASLKSTTVNDEAEQDQFVGQPENPSDSFVRRRVPRRNSLPIISSDETNNLIMPSNVRPGDVRLLDAMTREPMNIPRDVFVSNEYDGSPMNSLRLRRRLSLQHENLDETTPFQGVNVMRKRFSLDALVSTMTRRQSFSYSMPSDNEKKADDMNSALIISGDMRNNIDIPNSLVNDDHPPKDINEEKIKAYGKESNVNSCGSSTDSGSLDSSYVKETFRNKKKSSGDNVINHDNWFPNNPHPSLEYPVLYFILKCLPNCVMIWIRKVYTIRWELSYPLQRRLPLSKKFLRKIGISLTWGEALLWAPFIIILIQGMLSSFVNPSVTESGLVARLPLAICFLTANHNSILSLLLGIPFERAVKYHKVSGYTAFINGIFHTYIAFVADLEGKSSNMVEFVNFSVDGQVNTSGTMLLMVILAMIITSLPVVRRITFEVFYYFHIAFAIAMTACAFYHSGLFVVIIVTMLWGGDLFVRKVIMTWRYPRTASIKRITDTIVEISIPKTKNFDYNCGQYMFLAIPEISIFQFHPISISSSPYQQNVTFHVRKRGYWTKALYDLAGKKNQIALLLEGPYGSLGVDLTTNRYKIAMFLSGGIGVTPMQSICHQMLYEHEWGERDLKKLHFIWTARDPAVMESMDVVSQHSESKVIDHSISIIEDGKEKDLIAMDASVITGRMLVDMPMSHTPDEELERDFPTDDFIDDDDDDDDEEKIEKPPQGQTEVGIDEENQYRNSIIKNRSTEEIETVDTRSTKSAEEVLQLDCYLTAREMEDAGITSLPFVHKGRPDMKQIFLDLREEAIKAGERRVAICVCAPKRLVQICKMACTKYSNRKVRFDFHSEVFE